MPSDKVLKFPNFFYAKRFWITLCLIILVGIPLVVTNRYTLNIFILVLFYAFMGYSWNIVCGFVGELSLGHSVFVGVGGYVSTLLFINLGISPWLGMVAGMAVSAVAGVIVGFPCFKAKGPYFTLATIAFSELLRIYVTNTETGLFGLPLKGAMGLLLPYDGEKFSLFTFNGKVPYYYIILVFFLVAIVITVIIKRNKLGYYLTAIKSDPNAAESLGINITKYKLIAIVISSAMIGCAGTFYAQYFRYIGPERIFGHNLAIEIALIALIGGQGTVLGPALGAIVLIPISEYLAAHFGSIGGLHLFIYGVVMILVVMFMPKGIVEVFHRLGNKLGLGSRR
jgi:branched-chain amino acid transport system permease protein